MNRRRRAPGAFPGHIPLRPVECNHCPSESMQHDEEGEQQPLTRLLLQRELGTAGQRRGTAGHAGGHRRAQKRLEEWAERGFLQSCSATYVPWREGSPRSTIAAAFSQDGALMASTHGDHTVKVMSCDTSQLVRELHGHQRTPWVVRFNPAKPSVVASGSLDNSVILWDAHSGQKLVQRDFGKPIASLAIHYEGSILSVASGHKVYTWDYTQHSATAPHVILKTRKSLRALHFHPLGCPVLLTAEVVERKSSSTANPAAPPGPEGAPPQNEALLRMLNIRPPPPPVPPPLFPAIVLPDNVPPEVLAATQAVAPEAANSGATTRTAATALRTAAAAASGQASPNMLVGSLRVPSGHPRRVGHPPATRPADLTQAVREYMATGDDTTLSRLLHQMPGPPRQQPPRVQVLAPPPGPPATAPVPPQGAGQARVAAPSDADALSTAQMAVLVELAAYVESANRASSSRELHGWLQRLLQQRHTLQPALHPLLGSPRLLPLNLVENYFAAPGTPASATSSAAPSAAGADEPPEVDMGVPTAEAANGASAQVPALSQLSLQHATPSGSQSAMFSGPAGVQNQSAPRGPLIPLVPMSTLDQGAEPAFNLHWGWEVCPSLADEALRNQRDMLFHHLHHQLPVPSAQDQPCIVNLTLWPFSARNPEKQLSSPLLQLPRTVLCSEMGTCFSKCGRFLAVCVDVDDPSTRCLQWLQRQQTQQSTGQHTPQEPSRQSMQRAGARVSQDLMDSHLPRSHNPPSVSQQEQQTHIPHLLRSHALSDFAWADTAWQPLAGPTPRTHTPVATPNQLLQLLSASRQAGSLAALQPAPDHGQAQHAVGRSQAVQDVTAPQSPGGAVSLLAGTTAANGHSRNGSFGGWAATAQNAGTAATAQHAATATPGDFTGFPVHDSGAWLASPFEEQRGPAAASQGQPTLGQRLQPGLGPAQSHAQHNHATQGGFYTKQQQPQSRVPFYELRVYSLDEATFGQILHARPIRAAQCLTSIQFSPTSRHLLVAYGRRHINLCSLLLHDGVLTPVHTAVEIFRVRDMSLVRQLTVTEDEVNVAAWHPHPGGGIIYGTKEGKLRVLSHDRRTPERPSIPLVPRATPLAPDQELWEAEQDGRESVSEEEV